MENDHVNKLNDSIKIMIVNNNMKFDLWFKIIQAGIFD